MRLLTQRDETAVTPSTAVTSASERAEAPHLLDPLSLGRLWLIGSLKNLLITEPSQE